MKDLLVVLFALLVFTSCGEIEKTAHITPMTVSDFVQKNDIASTAIDRLQKEIELFDGITEAKVLVVMRTIDAEPSVSLSINADGRSISVEKVNEIKILSCKYIDLLKPENVAIIDVDGYSLHRKKAEQGSGENGRK